VSGYPQFQVRPQQRVCEGGYVGAAHIIRMCI
jgi:hypothetical protein